MSATVQMSHVSTILAMLEGLMTPGFGPNSLNTMLSTATGQMIVTSDSFSILQALHLSHPIGKLVVESVKRHTAATGDGGKSLIIILAQVFREIEHAICSDDVSSLEGQHQRIMLVTGLTELKGQLLTLLKPLVHHCQKFSVTQESNLNVIKQECVLLVKTKLQGMFPFATTKYLTDIIISFLFDGIQNFHDLLPVLSDACANFDLLYLEAVGYPVTMSRILDGFVIQRDFNSLHADLTKESPLKLVLVGCSLDGDDGNTDEAVYSVQSRQSAQEAMFFKVRTAALIAKHVLACGARLIISTEKISNREATACLAQGISMVQMADEEEVDRLSTVLGIHVVHSLSEFLTDSSPYIGEVTKCDTVIVSGRKFVHLLWNSQEETHSRDREFISQQVLITGHSKGSCCQVRMAIKSCLCYLRHWLACPPCSESTEKETRLVSTKYTIIGGGAFELSLHEHLKQLAKGSSKSLSLASSVLSKALLSIPLFLLRNSYHPQAKSLNVINIFRKRDQAESPVFGVDGRSGNLLRVETTDVRESLGSKVDLIYHILDLTVQILRTEKLVSVSAVPKQPAESDDE